MSITHLAAELTDAIIDHLYDDRASLKATSLTCKRFSPASQFHLFADVELRPSSLSTHPFPATLAHLVEKLRVTGASQSRAPNPWAFGGYAIPPPSLTGRQIREGLLPFRSQSLELQDVKSSSNSAVFAALIKTETLTESVRSLSLKGCTIETQDPLTLAHSLPHLRSLRFSELSFDNSRAAIRKMESASPMSFWACSRDSFDWSTITDSVSTDGALELNEIEVHDSEWTANLRAMMVSLLERVEPSDTFTLRLSVSISDLSGEWDGFGARSQFAQFLSQCGDKVRHLELSLVSFLSIEFFELFIDDLLQMDDRVGEKQTSSSQDVQPGWIFELCPRIELLRLLGVNSGGHTLMQSLPCSRR